MTRTAYWQNVTYPAIVARIQTYPEQTDYARRLYANALKGSDALLIERKEGDDVCEIIEKFRMKLREYKLALMTCKEYCEDLANNVIGDYENLYTTLEYDDFEGDVTPEDTERKKRRIRKLLITLAREQATLKIIWSSCEAHYGVVKNKKEALELSQKQGNLYRLELLYMELKQMDVFTPEV